jgi:hypothetical protein
MPRPSLPDELRKDPSIKVRFLQSEMHILAKQAKLHKCKSISHYIRKLVKDDVSNNRQINTLPDIC